MHRVSLPNEFLEGANNVYLFTGSQNVLVDTGYDAQEIRTRLEGELGDQGVTFGDIDAVVLTHYHIDHTGLAATIQQEGGATVYAHPVDAPLVAGNEEAWAAVTERRHRAYEDWGIPESKRTELEETFIEGADIYDDVTITSLEPGEQFDVGETLLEPVHSPGHTAGHVSILLRGRNEVLAGDALLPEYTPNVGGADVRLDRPLERYLDTLAWFRDADLDHAWPGHRGSIPDPGIRARTIIEHHEERAWRVLSILHEEGPLTAWEVSAELFGALEGVHILHGPGEAYAHLDHLSRTGPVERVGNEYRLTAEGESEFEAHGDDSWSLT